jgi:hypothetical protein
MTWAVLGAQLLGLLNLTFTIGEHFQFPFKLENCSIKMFISEADRHVTSQKSQNSSWKIHSHFGILSFHLLVALYLSRPNRQSPRTLDAKIN